MTIFATLLVLGLLWGGVYLLMAEGLNLIYGVMKVVNLAHGDFIVVGGMLALTLYGRWGVSPLVALPVAAVLLFLLGAAVQAGVLERIPLAGADAELRTLLATFGLSYVVANVSFLIWGAQFQSIPFLQGSLAAGRIVVPEGLLVCAVLAASVAVAAHVWLRHTITGRSVRATAQSAVGAAACGLDVRRLRVVTFGLGAAMAGGAGALVIALVPFQTASGADLTVQAFTLIALGGLGSYPGAWLAAELLGITEVLTQYWLGSDAAAAVVYVIFIAVLVFRPQGLLGAAGRI